MNPLSNPYDRFKGELKFFSVSDLVRIETFAASMTEDEVLDYFMIEREELSKGDSRIFTKAFNRGRARAISTASEHLFANMKDSKSGAAACLSYLKRHADNYTKEVDDTEAKDGFVYNLNITTSEKGNEIQEAKESEGKVVPLKSV